MRSLDLLYMFLCFNIGIWIVGILSPGGFGFISMEFVDIAKLTGVVTVTAILGAVAAAWLTGADPGKIVVIGFFVGTVASLFTSATVVLGSIAAWMDKGASFPIASSFLAIFIIIETVIAIMSVAQIATGGFKANE